MCGAQYTPPAEPPIHATARPGPFAGKTGWRRQSLTRLQLALPVADIMPSDRFHAVTVDEESEGIILDEPQHDSDVAGLIDRPN